MQTSYRFLSRLHLQYHTYNPSRNRDLRFLITLNTNDNFTPKFRRFSSRSFFSCNRRSGLSSLVKEREAAHPPIRYFSQQGFITRPKLAKTEISDHDSMRALKTGLCSFLVFSLKLGAWFVTSSHVLMAEVVHSFANFSDKLLHAYGLSSSRIAPWSVNIFTLAATVVTIRGILYLGTAQHPENIQYAALVIGGSFIIEGASLLAAIQDVKKGAAAEGVLVSHYIWHAHDPTSIDVLVKNVAAVTGLAIAGASLVAVNATGNTIYDPIGSIVVGSLLGTVSAFLIVRNQHVLISRSIDDQDMKKILHFLKNDPVVESLYDWKSEVIGPGFFRVKAEIDFDELVLVKNYLKRADRVAWTRQFREAVKKNDNAAMDKLISNYVVQLVTSEASEVDRLKNEIQQLVPAIRDVDIVRHIPTVPIRHVETGLLDLIRLEDTRVATRPGLDKKRD